MNLIDICIITIISSIAMKIRYKLELYKCISDLGYKFNRENLEKYEEELEKNSNTNELAAIISIKNKLTTFIPFFNLIDDALRETRYYNDKELNIQRLIDLEIIEQMTEDEEKDYNQYKTGFYAMIMERRKHLRELKANIVTEKDSIIRYELDKNNPNASFKDRIIIIKVDGLASELNEEKLKELIYKHTLRRTISYLQHNKDIDTVDEEIKAMIKEINDKKIEQTTTIYGNESIHSKEETQEEQQVSEEQTKPKTKIRRP